MASLREKPRSPYWYACLTLPDGSRTERSTKIRMKGAKERRLALDIANAWEQDLAPAQSVAQAQRVASDIHEKLTGRALPTATLGDYVKQWLDAKEGEVSSGTLDYYRTRLSKFVQWAGEDRQIVTFTVDDLRDFRTAEGRRVQERTVNGILKTVRMLFRSAKRDGLIAENPCEDLRPLKAPPSNRRPFDMTAVKDILAAADPEWRSMVLFGFYTGLRLKDIALLELGELYLDEQEIRLHTSKTGRRQKIPIHPALMNHLLDYSTGDDPEEPLHPRAHRVVTKQGKTGMLSRQFYSLMAQAGVVSRRSHRKSDTRAGDRRNMSPVTFHSLRHTATSLLKNLGVSGPVVEELIGHDSAEMNRVYTHIDPSVLREANARLPEL